MAIYDVTLGGISFPTIEQTFSETVGGAYVVVGAAVLPGPPSPASIYNITIPVYGDSTETDPQAVGFSLRAQIKSLLQNDAVRFRGLYFTTTFDPDIDGWIVIGNADISYGTGGPTFGDFVLTINGAALIPAQQTLQAHRIVTTDRRSVAAPLDRNRNIFRAEPLKADATARHYLPVGAADVVGQIDPIVVPTQTYDTIFGKGVYITDRAHAETVTFEQPPEDIGKSDVRIFDQNSAGSFTRSPEGDIDPESHYGWKRAYGPLWALKGWPVLDNGRCQIDPASGNSFDVYVSKNGKYVKSDHFTLGYPDTGRVSIVEWTPERAQLRGIVAGTKSRAEVYMTLQRGWPGPKLDIYHQGDRKGSFHVESDAQVETEDKWTHVRIGVSRAESLFDVQPEPTLITRF